MEKIVFYHIGKTAGTSIADIVHNNYKRALATSNVEGESYTERSNYITSNIDSIVDKYDAITGHMELPLLKVFINHGFKAFTFFRDPLDLFISSYYFNKRTEEHPGFVFANKYSLSQYALYCRWPYSDNPLTRMMSGVHYDVPRGGLNRRHLGKAIANIDLFHFIGFLEMAPRSIAWLANAFGWTNTDMPTLNKTENRKSVDQLDENEKDILNTTQRYDIDLYSYTLKRMKPKLTHVQQAIRRG